MEGGVSFGRELTASERAAVMAAMIGGDDVLSLADAVGETLDAAFVVVHRIEYRRTDGQVAAADRLVIIAPDGQAYATTSPSAVDCARRIMQTYGLPPYDPALRVTVATRRTKSGHRTLLLRPAQ